MGPLAPGSDGAAQAESAKLPVGGRSLEELVDIIVDQVAEQYVLTAAEIRGRSMNRRVTWARHVVLALAAEFSLETHAEIARQFGLDRTSVDHAARHVHEASEANPLVMAALATLRANIEDRAPETRLRRLTAVARREQIKPKPEHLSVEREAASMLRTLRRELVDAIRLDPAGFVVGLSRVCREINSKGDQS